MALPEPPWLSKSDVLRLHTPTPTPAPRQQEKPLPTAVFDAAISGTATHAAGTATPLAELAQAVMREEDRRFLRDAALFKVISEHDFNMKHLKSLVPDDAKGR